MPDASRTSARRASQMRFPTVVFPLPDSPTTRAPPPRRRRTRRRRPRARPPPPPTAASDVEVLDEISTSSTGLAPFLPRMEARDEVVGPDPPELGDLRAGARPRGGTGGERAEARQLGQRRHAARDLLELPVARAGRGNAPSSPIVYGCWGCAYSSSTGASSALRPAYMTTTGRRCRRRRRGCA